MLPITNGDIAADRIRAAKIPGEVLPWRDVLHEAARTEHGSDFIDIAGPVG